MQTKSRIVGIALGLAAALAAGEAGARPVYATKEGKQCAYCHINSRGGGPRNPRGEYYAAHNHSFQGFDEEKIMGLLKRAWKEALSAPVSRVGVGDTTGDGKPRLVTILAAGEGATVEIRKWTGTEWAVEGTAAAPGGAERLAVGNYAQGKPAVIVTSGALVWWNGARYEVRPAPRKLDVVGSVALKDGTERLLLREGETPGENLKAYRVDPAAGGADWLKDGAPSPRTTETTFSDLKAPPAELRTLGVPDPIADGGVLGIWDPNRPNLLFLYGVQVINQVEGPPDAKPDQLKLVGQDHHITIVDPRSLAYRTLWASEKLQGKVLDVTRGDPKSGKRGLLVLTDSGEDGKARTLYFFQLE